MFNGDKITLLNTQVTELYERVGRQEQATDQLLNILGVVLERRHGYTFVCYAKDGNMVTAEGQTHLRKKLNALMDYLGVEEETIEAQPKKTIIRAKAPKTKVSEEAQ
jgi:hypothetical protein